MEVVKWYYSPKFAKKATLDGQAQSSANNQGIVIVVEAIVGSYVHEIFYPVEVGGG